MNPKLSKQEFARIDEIADAFKPFVDAAERFHNVVFKKGNKTLVHDPRFKSIVYSKEIVIHRLCKIQAQLNKLRVEK